MANSSLFNRLTAFSALAFLTACVSVQSAAPVAGDTRAPATVKTETLTKKIELHDAAKHDYEIGSLDTKTSSIENREDRLEFKVHIEGLLARKDDRLPKEAEICLEEALRLLEKLDTETPAFDDIARLQETIEAYNSNFLAPVPPKIWIGALPVEVIKRLHHSIMNRRAPEAVNLVVRGTDDPSKVDPKPSAFWQPGRDLAKADLYNGFGRSGLPRLTEVCKYNGPKKSYGVHGGFKLDCGSEGKWKLKFGNEAKTEPFNSRLVWALGYNVSRVDYLPEGLRVDYDRALLTEYNSRKALKIDVKSVLGFKYFSRDIQVALNPFVDAVSGAYLRDGTYLSSEKLRAKLIKSMPRKKGKDDWGRAGEAKFDEAFEKTVKTFVLKQASIEEKTPDDLEEMGSWSWKTLDHPDRRELRAFGLATAWVNAFDMRQNNNKTFLRKKPDGSTELMQEVSDLGSGFGRASNILHYKNGAFDEMPWDLVRLRANVGDEDGDTNEDDEPVDPVPWVSPFKFPSYSVLESNPAFGRMQLDDARWMARKLASLSEEQIQDGLIGAGFTAAECRLVLEKLLDRRQQMIDVFGLAKEFPEVMERKIDRRVSFDPKKDAAPKTKNAANPVAARVTSQRLVKGRLVP